MAFFLPLNTCTLILVENKKEKKRSLPGLIFQYSKHTKHTIDRFEFGLQLNEIYFL